VARREVLGTAEAVLAVLLATGTGAGVDAASSGRLNASSRGAMTPLVRRGRWQGRTPAMAAGLTARGAASEEIA
jgi:hypothetical protein